MFLKLSPNGWDCRDRTVLGPRPVFCLLACEALPLTESLKKKFLQRTRMKVWKIPSDVGVLPARSLCALESHGVCLECYRALEISGNGCHPIMCRDLVSSLRCPRVCHDKSFSVPLLSVIKIQKFSLYQTHSEWQIKTHQKCNCERPIKKVISELENQFY